LIFPDSYDPYGSLISEEINDDFSKDDEGIDIVLPEAHAEEKEPSKDSVGYHIERRTEILKSQAEEKIRNESITNLVSYGIIAGIGVLILKRFL